MFTAAFDRFNQLIHEKKFNNLDARLYESLAETIDELLVINTSHYDLFQEFRPIDSNTVGRIYQHLKNFRLSLENGDVILVKDPRDRRNSGLFYTPDLVVEKIVSLALSGFSREELPNLTILDPAVGSGQFISFAHKWIIQKLESCSEQSRYSSAFGSSSKINSGNIAKHLVDHCLYGVDVDPIAIKICRAGLAHAGYGSPDMANRITNIFQGNALIGEVKPMNPQISLRSHGFNWYEKLPHIINHDGFDIIIGNPPYEVLSVKESGLMPRREEQRYFRDHYKYCQGKLNTYRLMLERSLELLKPGGLLCFIMPLTFLGDSTAENLRRSILQHCRLEEIIIIQEKEKIFPGVTQAFAIILLHKNSLTRKIKSSFMKTGGDTTATIEIPLSLIKAAEYRIPVLKCEEDKQLLALAKEINPFRGNCEILPAGLVHQGEVNLSVDRPFVTEIPTGLPLIRGEHIFPFSLNHPCRRSRLDWVLPEFCSGGFDNKKTKNKPWENERIALARVVNMHTKRRLKAAICPAQYFQGDMTNYVIDIQVDRYYLLGLLNSKLLNAVLNLTATNNYISAAEITALPIVRPELGIPVESKIIERLLEYDCDSIVSCLATLQKVRNSSVSLIPQIIHRTAKLLSHSKMQRRVLNLMDAAVLMLYGAEFYAEILDSQFPGEHA